MRGPIIERAFSQRLAVTRIAEATGISTAAVSQWKRVPERHVLAVSKITGIAPHDLRPDLYPAPEAQAA